eukprot:tig00021521_g22068.t1
MRRPEELGKLSVGVSVDGAPLAGTPLPWTVLPARASGAKSKVLSFSPEPGTPAVAGSEVRFVVEAYDVCGNVRPPGTDEANLSVLFEPAAGGHAYLCSLKDGAPVTRPVGTDAALPAGPPPFALTGVRALLGYEVSRYEKSLHSPSSYSNILYPLLYPLLLTRVLLYPLLLTRGQVSAVSRDEFGNLREAGGDQEASPSDPKGERRWNAIATLERGTGVKEPAAKAPLLPVPPRGLVLRAGLAQTSATPSITDIGGGCYAVEFEPPAPGRWVLYVAHGADRAAHPLPLDVATGAANAAKSQLTPMDPVICEAGSSSQLRLEVPERT